MAEKSKQPIIIKKVYEEAAAAHGGAWKVAFADFMTAMMCFFLVMWLLNQSEPVKKQIASYFSGPSVLEQNFKAYGAELTFEKLFLDIVNEPLKTLQTIMDPADLSPNILAMGSKKVALKYLETELGKQHIRYNVDSDRVSIEIPDMDLFESGTSMPSKEFTDIMTTVTEVTRGLEDSKVLVESILPQQAVEADSYQLANKIANERLDLVGAKINASFESPTVSFSGSAKVTDGKSAIPGEKNHGWIKITMAQKDRRADGGAQRPLVETGRDRVSDMKDYDDTVKKATQKKRSR